MAEVVPFRGVLYNPELIQNFEDVVAPPYDVISADEQEGFHQRHPNNVIRLILGKAQPGDNGHHNIHQRAAKYFHQWMEEKVLVRDERPALYLTSAEFTAGRNTVIRYGIIGAVRLEPFDKGIILPHERTFSKVKSERLQLMKSCHTNFSPIFGLYSDTRQVLKRLRDAAAEKAPDMDLFDNKGTRHRLWRITDDEALAHVTRALQDQKIYIADGHHRYETALNYKTYIEEQTEGFSSTHPANYVMMSLSSLEDPGMVIFPAHRLIKDIPEEDVSQLLEQVTAYFDIHSFPTHEGVESALAAADDTLEVNAHRNAVCLFARPYAAIHVLVLKAGIMEKLFANEIPNALLDLDVTVLTRLIMTELLGFDQTRLDDASKIGYCTASRDAVDAVMSEEADLACILNPTKIEQVQRIAEHGLIMPRKSTYFYPKVMSGQVFSLLD